MGFSYRQAIGELIFAMTICRIDISAAIIKLSQYAANRAKSHYQAVRAIFTYLNHTKLDGIYYWHGGAPNQTLNSLTNHTQQLQLTLRTSANTNQPQSQPHYKELATQHGQMTDDTANPPQTSASFLQGCYILSNTNPTHNCTFEHWSRIRRNDRHWKSGNIPPFHPRRTRHNTRTTNRHSSRQLRHSLACQCTTTYTKYTTHWYQTNDHSTMDRRRTNYIWRRPHYI